jgi:hypothetical protein
MPKQGLEKFLITDKYNSCVKNNIIKNDFKSFFHQNFGHTAGHFLFD